MILLEYYSAATTHGYLTPLHKIYRLQYSIDYIDLSVFSMLIREYYTSRLKCRKDRTDRKRCSSDTSV